MPKTLDFAHDPQVTNLRYSRLQVCATSVGDTVNRYEVSHHTTLFNSRPMIPGPTHAPGGAEAILVPNANPGRIEIED